VVPATISTTVLQAESDGSPGIDNHHAAGARMRAQVCPRTPRSQSMKSSRFLFVLAATVLLASSMSFAQDGAALYKSKCAMCHGATGTPSAGMANMGVKPVSDPSVKALTVDQISAVVKNGKGKMHPVAGLTDEQVKAVATYFKTLK
jgi:cytochrome c553